MLFRLDKHVAMTFLASLVLALFTEVAWIGAVTLENGMTTLSGIASTGLSLVAALGGVGAVAAAVAKWVSDHSSKKWLQEHKGELDQALETHRAELAKETETHKLTLKRQELMFQRELEAADAFVAIWRIVRPEHRFPGMDWHDACTDVASHLGQVEKVLAEFLQRHSVAVSGAVRDKLEHARSEAASEKFFVEEENVDPPDAAVTAAGNILDALQEARDQIFADLRR